ncbi:MAG: stage II sporulation protein M [Lachnospiraceae bacterium]|jgi:stage II sporulation protein M|nr:stage II sporulation protein M [Lachnospiraceae bacterium]
MRKQKRQNIIKELIVNHFKNNVKEYMIVIAVLLIGIVSGVFFVNNSSDIQKNEITSYVNSFVNSFKENTNNIDMSALLKDSIIQNITLGLALWFMGSTVIGIVAVYLIVLYRGFSLSYTIASVIGAMPGKSGIIFTLSTLLIHNIIVISVMLALAVSGIRLYKSIMRDRRKENIKMEIIRHTIISLIFTMILVLASFVEVYVSTNILKSMIVYI